MSAVSANAAVTNAEKSGSSSVISDSSIGVTMDNGEPKDTDGLQGTEGDTSEGSYTGAVTAAMAQTFGSIQSVVSNLASGDENKECPSEVVFAVVAVDNNISELIQSSFNNVGLSKTMQLSLIPTSIETSTSTINTDDVQLASTQNSDGFNQVTLIASTIEQSSQGDKSQEFLPQKKDGMKKPAFDVTTPDTLDPTDKVENKTDGNLSKKPRVMCPVCDLDFSDLPSMRRHSLIHSEEKPYQCEFCEKAFRRKDNLREHRNIHTLENVYSCTHCGKTFPRKYTHKVHMARFCTREKSTHTITRKDDGMITWEDAATKTTHGSSTAKALSMKMTAPNSKCSDPCHICLKTFRDSSTLKRHLLTHSDERPFKCDQCKKSFRRKDHLQEHIIVHNEVRPFPCPQCGKSFSRKNGLKTHMIRTSHRPVLKDFPSKGGMLFESVAESSMNCSEDADNDELAEAEGNSCEFQEMLTSDQFSENADVNNQSDVTKVNQQQEKEDFVASVTISINLDSSEINPQSGRNSGVNPGNTTTIVGLKQTDVTVVISEKSVGTPNASDLGQFNANTSEISNSQNEKLSEDEENQKVNDEQCLATFTETELYQEHQKKCEVTCTNTDTDTQSLDFSSKEGETMPGSQSDDEITEDALEDGGEMADGELGQGFGGKAAGGDVTNKGQRLCTVCNKQFRDTTALRRHSLVHSGERPHTCDQCDKRFRRRDHLKSHMTTTHHCGTMTFSCKNCEMVFNTRYSLSMHSKSCKKDIACPQTQPVEPTPKPVIVESKSCPICHKGFKDHSTQRRHLKVHSEDRPFPCDLCSKSFRRKDNLKEHMMCHSEQKPFACDDCGKALSRRSSLTNHRSICPMRRMDATAAVTVTENTSIPETSFEEASVTNDSVMCLDNNAQELNSSVEDMQELRSGGDDGVGNHSDGEDVGNHGDCDNGSIHGDEDVDVGNHGDGSDDVANQGDGKSFSCNQCGKAFHAKWTLKYHQRVHTGEKPYTCLTCERQFRQPSHLKIHERTHSGERPYVCEVCGRAFIDSSTMRRHARLHKTASNGDDIVHDSGGSEETGVDPSETITVEIQVAVSSGDETVKSAQPISTSVVSGVNQSEVPNLVHVPGINQSEVPIVHMDDHAGEMALPSKMDTLDNINW